MSTSPVIKWLSSPSGRSQRSSRVERGCYMLEHDATGRFYVGASRHVSDEVDTHLEALAQEKHAHKLFQGLYRGDTAIRVYEYPTKSDKVIVKLLGDLLREQANDYLCINPDFIKKFKKAK